MKNRIEEIIIDDKNIIVINKIHRNPRLTDPHIPNHPLSISS
jgi:hypothetical protein